MSMFNPSPYVEHILQPGILDWSEGVDSPSEIIDLTVGQPDFDVPYNITEMLYYASRNGKNGYTDSQGIIELRTKISELKCINNSQDIIITNGVTGGLFLLLMTCFKPGDEIILTDPYFIQYKILMDIFNLKIKYVNTYPDFKPTLQRIRAVVTKYTKAIILNYPNNPTGTILDIKDFKEIVSFSKMHNIYVIYDEIYEAFTYNNYYTINSIPLENNVFVLGGFSKKYSMTGWRVGYLIGDRIIIKYLTELQAQMCQGVNSVSQYAAIEALNTDMSDMILEYKNRNEFIKTHLSKEYLCSNSQGGFFFFIQVPLRLNISATDFCIKMKKRGVLLVPGRVFSQTDTHFRLAICKDISILSKAVEILNEVCNG